MRILIVQCFVALLGITYGAVELKPGFWNDKPWELADLEKRLAANDPEAFAEKAYWIADGWGGQVYDKKLMFQLAKKAAEGGSLIGETFLARCYMYGLGTKKDEAAAGKIIRKILPEGHPYTLNYYSNCLSDGSCGFSKDLEKGLKVRQDAIDKGCGMAFRNHLISVYEGVNGVAENKKKAVSMAAARLRAGGKNSECALIILRAFSWRVMAPELGDKKLIVMAEERARIAADLGHPAAMQNYAYYLGHAGRPNEAVPYMVRAAQIGDEDSLGRLVEMSIGGGTSRRNHSVGQYSTHYRLARLAWDAGNRFPSVTESAAESYLFKWSAEKPAPLKALPILEYDLQRGENVHGLLGKFYCEFDHAKHDAKRGEAHFIYSIPYKGRTTLHALTDAFFVAPERGRDLAKARAAAKQGLKLLKEEVRLNKLNRRLELIEEEITPEDLARSNELLEANWPFSQKDMDGAVATLIEYGTLPKDTKSPKVR